MRDKKVPQKDKDKKSFEENKNENTVNSDQPKSQLGPNLGFASREAYNLLRTNLAFSYASSDRGKIIGITSPCPEDGKSFTSINLSYSIAEAGNKVLLIDTDLRRSSFADKLDLPPTPGLSNYLVGDPRGIIHKSVLEDNLDIVMSGDLSPNPSELLGSEQMENVLKIFANDYDYVILDLPPVNSVSDPLVVSKFLDGFIIVVRHNVTKKSDIKEAIRQLEFSKAHLFGFVYNAYRRGRKRYYKYSKYSKYSKYGYGYGYGYYKK